MRRFVGAVSAPIFCREGGGALHHGRRQRIIASARRLEPALDLPALRIAGLARHAKLIFGAVVIEFEISIA
jgi:hypothetical protein